MTATRICVRFHGANAVSRWLYARWYTRPLAWVYYRLVRQFLTTYWVYEDDRPRPRWI